MYADSAYGPTKLVNLGGGGSIVAAAAAASFLDFLLRRDAAEGLKGPKYFFFLAPSSAWEPLLVRWWRAIRVGVAGERV